MRPQRSAKEMIQEGLEEYLYEPVVRPQEEKEMWQNYEKTMNQLYEKKEKRIEAFVKSHLEENNYGVCGKCYRSCDLLD